MKFNRLIQIMLFDVCGVSDDFGSKSLNNQRSVESLVTNYNGAVFKSTIL